MISRSAPNMVASLLKQLQPYLIAPINEAQLVEDMLRVEFQLSPKVDLLYWVNILPPVYYHTILNVISVEAFKQWYDRLLDYKAAYHALSEEQQNEWELALFYFRDKFRRVFDKESFRDILERKEERLDMLGWRLKREPPLPLPVLAKLACLNYSAVKAYVEIHIPDLKERLAFLKSAEINVDDEVISNPWPLVGQYNCWLGMLSPEESDKKPLALPVSDFSFFATEKTSLMDSQSKLLEGEWVNAPDESSDAEKSCCLIS